MKSIRLNLDALGVCASTLCMIHCLVLPLLLAVLPLWNLSATAQNSVAAFAPTDESPAANASPSEAVGCEERDCCPGTGALSDAASLPVTTALPASAVGEHAGCCSTPTDFWIHVGLLAAVAPLGLIAWSAGYRRHRRMGVLGLGLAGVLLLCAALLFGQHLLGGRGEQVMTVLGSVCMVSAHLWNRRQCRCCRSPDVAHVLEIESVSSVSQQVSLSNGGVS